MWTLPLIYWWYHDCAITTLCMQRFHGYTAASMEVQSVSNIVLPFEVCQHLSLQCIHPPLPSLKNFLGSTSNHICTVLNSSTLYCWNKCSSSSIFCVHNTAKSTIQLYCIAGKFGGGFSLADYECTAKLKSKNFTITIAYLPADGFEMMVLYKYFAKENAEHPAKVSSLSEKVTNISMKHLLSATCYMVNMYFSLSQIHQVLNHQN